MSLQGLLLGFLLLRLIPLPRLLLLKSEESWHLAKGLLLLAHLLLRLIVGVVAPPVRTSEHLT